MIFVIKPRGFSLIEILLVVAILAIVLSIGMPITSRFQVDSQLNETAELLTENIRLAVQDSQAGWQDTRFGLKFIENQYVVFQGNDYAGRLVAKDRIVPIMEALRIELNLSPVTDEIRFNRQGLSAVSGQIKIIHNDGASKTLFINNMGLISQL